MVLLVLLKGEAGFSAKLIGLINGFSITLCCLFAGKAQPSPFWRYTRLTNDFSRKIENHSAAVALYYSSTTS